MWAKRGKLLVGLLLLALAAGLACRRKPHSVTLNWQPPKTPTGMSVVSYNVYRRTMEDGRYIRIATGVSGPPYEDHQVAGGRTYFYAITALNQNGRESRLSESIQAKIP